MEDSFEEAKFILPEKPWGEAEHYYLIAHLADLSDATKMELGVIPFPETKVKGPTDTK